MSRANEYPRASSILASLGLVAQLTAAATDGIPVAKLVVGVVSRIVMLAEDIEKRRTGLHALAETARTTGEGIKAVLAHREPGEEIERSLEGLHTVFRAIEVLFVKHRAKKAFFRALSYAFTTAAHIDDLNQELSRATQQFAVVATLETHARVQEANARLQETNDRLEDAKGDIRELQIRLLQDSVYNGKFRNLHDCDVSKLKLIHEYTVSRSRYRIKYYTARLNDTRACFDAENAAQVFVLRYFEHESGFTPGGATEDNDYLSRRVSRHDMILEKFSTVRNMHPNIARIYGRSLGGHTTRFTVMKSGYIPISKVAPRTASIEQTWDVILQILDALCHLDERGASWKPDGGNGILLDDSGVPIIGLINDLRPGNQKYHIQGIGVLGALLEDLLGDYSEELSIDADSQHTPIALLGGVSTPWSGEGRKHRIPRRLIPPLKQKISRYLQKALAGRKNVFRVLVETGIVVLRAAASSREMGSAVLTAYWATDNVHDSIEMCRVEERDDELIYYQTSIRVPVHMKDEIRKKSGITARVPPLGIEPFISTRDPADPRGMSFRPYIVDEQ